MAIEITDLCETMLPHKIAGFFSMEKAFRCWNIRRFSSNQGEYLGFDISYLVDSYLGRTDQYQEGFSGHIILKTFEGTPINEELFWPCRRRGPNAAVMKFSPKFPDDWFDKIWDLKSFYAQFLVSKSVLDSNWQAFTAKVKEERPVIFQLPFMQAHQITTEFLHIDNDENEFVVGVEKLHFLHQLDVLELNPEARSAIHR